ncbi:hypothetical protein ACTMU2_09215 [Cupriavidus basilensis]
MDIPIVGNVKDVLQELIAQLQVSDVKLPSARRFAKWWEQIEQWRSVDCLRYDRSSEIIKPQYVVEKIWELTKGDAFICSDVGQHQMWAAQFYQVRRAAPLDQFRWPGHDGRGPAVCDGHQEGVPGEGSRHHHR